MPGPRLTAPPPARPCLERISARRPSRETEPEIDGESSVELEGGFLIVSSGAKVSRGKGVGGGSKTKKEVRAPCCVRVLEGGFSSRTCQVTPEGMNVPITSPPILDETYTTGRESSALREYNVSCTSLWLENGFRNGDDYQMTEAGSPLLHQNLLSALSKLRSVNAYAKSLDTVFERPRTSRSSVVSRKRAGVGDRGSNRTSFERKLANREPVIVQPRVSSFPRGDLSNVATSPSVSGSPARSCSGRRGQ